ncbi:MAG: glycoside hydrolase family 97 protein [Bacteroidales bacterium]
MKKNLWMGLTFLASSAFAAQYDLKSPDGKIQIQIETEPVATYSVSFNGKEVLAPSPFSMTFDNGETIGSKLNVISTKRDSKKETLRPVVRQKSESILSNYNELTLNAKNYKVHFRAYDDGIAYRFETSFPKNKIKVISEEVAYCFPGDFKTLFPEEKSVISPQQALYKDLKLSEIQTDKFCSTPLIVKPDDSTRLLITESDLESYPGMFLKKQNEKELGGKFAEFATAEKETKDRICYPTKRANYLAETKGKRSYPWRTMVISKNDKDLIDNQLVYKLAPEAESKNDFSWVKPGKISWDWWNASSVYGVDFKSGINTDTYKYFVDFASKYGIEYVVIDDGWSEDWDVTKPIAEMNMEDLIDYADKKNVGIILWVSWVPFEQKMDEAFALYEKWGVKGLKVDFMNRDDQRMVDFYYNVARKAEKHKMLVDFHGSYKPTGWSRTFPHVMTSEGVAGLENCKWSAIATPKHNVTLPFIRMVAGPMDYTPGGMNNLHEKDFKIWFDTPAAIGTRCHQLGMYVVYESPLQMLADSPTHYYKEDDCMEFLSKVPVVWDETRVLEGEIGEHIVVARRKGDKWYIGGMTGEKGKTFDVKLDFIDGEKTMTSWEDGTNVAMQARDYAKKTKKVSKGDTISLNMYDGGGYVAIIE